MTSILMLMYGPVHKMASCAAHASDDSLRWPELLHLEDDRIQRYQFEA